ncbi:MAG: FHA domain-containing protein [Candidatus Krumholzibacteriota bacterium]|nr:FHA domain-containing protein [Candidatus Krumholzibacteriota bacterium]
MDKTADGKSQAVLEEKLSDYWEVCAGRDEIADRLKKLEDSKNMVNEGIFEKVQGEYHDELTVVEASLEVLKGEIEDCRSVVERELDVITEAITSLEDELAEADLRHRVGEYTEKQITEFHRRVEPRLEKERARAGLLDSRVTGKRRVTDRGDDAAGTKAGKTATAAPATTAAPAATEALENPQMWADEPAPQPDDKPAPAAQTASSLADLEDDEDPLSALADPTTETRPPVNPGKKQDSSGYPLLHITTGGHEGRTIPLLPMTMSIGREHDNNIELKDPDVARYHARIVYERGRYSIEDLESSTGTLVNGEKTRQATLEPGDHIQIGSTMLVFDKS